MIKEVIKDIILVILVSAAIFNGYIFHHWNEAFITMGLVLFIQLLRIETILYNILNKE